MSVGALYISLSADAILDWSRPVYRGSLKTIGDLVSKETVCCLYGKVKHENKLSTTKVDKVN